MAARCRTVADRFCARRLPLPASRADHQRLQRRRFGLHARHLGNPVVGDLIQGNSIGDYFLYPVDPETGSALPTPDNVAFTEGQGNLQQGVVLNSSNTTVGGSNPQENNIICGNGAAGHPGRAGCLGQSDTGQPDRHGRALPQRPVLTGRQWRRGSSDRVHGQPDESAGTSSMRRATYVGSATGGNLISGNVGAGVQLVGVGAIRNLIQGNYIGVAPGGGYMFGTGDPGNVGDGVLIQDGSQNQIGGTARHLAIRLIRIMEPGFTSRAWRPATWSPTT